MKFLKLEECESDTMGMPDRFIEEYGDQIPYNVKLQIPNGRQFHVNYKKKEKYLSRVGLMLKEFKERIGLILVICYNGNENFLVYILNDCLTEIEYSILRRFPRGPVCHQGWKFLSRGIGPVLRDGADIPSRFMKRFGNIIPTSVTFELSNDELFPGSYLKSRKKLYGLLPIVRKKYLQLWDILMFIYFGNGRFQICIFDKSFQVKVVTIDLDSENESEPDNPDDNFGNVAIVHSKRYTSQWYIMGSW